jgi:phosphoserine phosphatase
MPAPDSTVEEVRSSVLRYLRMYEEGQLTLRDLGAELAVMSAAYEHAMGGIPDPYGALLARASRFERRQDAFEELEHAVTEFRREEARWD